MDFSLRKARREDVGRIMEIMNQAKAQMKREGSCQWDESYPAPENILADINADCAYTLCLAGEIAAYGAIVFTGEPAYDNIDGHWLTSGDYVVIHRIAVADEVKVQGVATKFFAETERLANERGTGSFRIDTNYDNKRMLHLMDKLGFSYCGVVNYPRGTRMAFEKIIGR